MGLEAPLQTFFRPIFSSSPKLWKAVFGDQHVGRFRSADLAAFPWFLDSQSPTGDGRGWENWERDEHHTSKRAHQGSKRDCSSLKTGGIKVLTFEKALNPQSGVLPKRLLEGWQAGRLVRGGVLGKVSFQQGSGSKRGGVSKSFMGVLYCFRGMDAGGY